MYLAVTVQHGSQEYKNLTCVCPSDGGYYTTMPGQCILYSLNPRIRAKCNTEQGSSDVPPRFLQLVSLLCVWICDSDERGPEEETIGRFVPSRSFIFMRLNELGLIINMQSFCFQHKRGFFIQPVFSKCVWQRCRFSFRLEKGKAGTSKEGCEELSQGFDGAIKIKNALMRQNKYLQIKKNSSSTWRFCLTQGRGSSGF